MTNSFMTALLLNRNEYSLLSFHHITSNILSPWVVVILYLDSNSVAQNQLVCLHSTRLQNSSQSLLFQHDGVLPADFELHLYL
jgi:hypothetical protein